MKVLLIYPFCPDSFWSFRYALHFILKKASDPPLGLLTVAAMLPRDWQIELIDMNVSKLQKQDILRADLVFVSAMSIQRKSVLKVIDQCHNLGRKIVAGGPLFTSQPDAFPMVDYLLLGEAEVILPEFLVDLSSGNPRKIYRATTWADITTTPLPRWDLIDFRKYASIDIQYSRGCPFRCSFCDISVLFGNVPRTKTREQILAEMTSLYSHGWRGAVFLVDDNFIGNIKKLKSDILPGIISWMQEHRYPFSLYTECSINMADDEPLMRMMAAAGFDTVFIGIETVDENSLVECGKVANCRRDIIASVRKIQTYGFEVMGGFIIGFDNDKPTVFDNMFEFIQDSGIVTAMVGLLNAPVNTTLYKRMDEEGRLIGKMTGDNTDISMNFIPAMRIETLISGYKRLMNKLYSPKVFYDRVRTFLSIDKRKPLHESVHFYEVIALLKTFIILGVIGKERSQYWKLLCWSIFRKPHSFRKVITYAIYGYHFRKMMQQYSQNGTPPTTASS